MSSYEAPKSGYDLLEALVVKWKPGQPARARAAQYQPIPELRVQSETPAAGFQPPTGLMDLIGALCKTDMGELEVEKRKGAPAPMGSCWR